MATQALRAMGPTEEGMSLPSLPSPTLTNPEMVLPDDIPNFRGLPSPPRQVRRDRPPSPSYLKDQANGSARTRSGSNGGAVMPAKKEKRGLMSRKMMLLRSRTASSGIGTKRDEEAVEDPESTYASSPTTPTSRNLAPPGYQVRRSSNGESPIDSGDESPALPGFLSEYESTNLSGTDEELESSPAIARYALPVNSFMSGLEAERRQKEEDEQQSAILSKRAEQILANAKKRLNLMEGNLRGARDLVAPLTAANLRRATSVASYVPPTSSLQDGYYYDGNGQPHRTLQVQASSPTMGRDYQGHWRGFSETELPERPYTALDSNASPIIAQGFIPTKANDPLWTKALRGSRSHDSLGNLAFRRPGSRDPYYSRNSPDPNLEPLVEDDDPVYEESAGRTSSQLDSEDEYIRYRGSTTPDDLHEQMSSLKGRISALKERAREDSIRRQSMQNLREPSPLNNATDNAPEFLYSSSPTYETSAANARASRGTRPIHHDRQESYETVWESDQVIPGSRNAFAEQAQRNWNRELRSDGKGGYCFVSKEEARPATSHKRTPSGTAVIQSSKHRYSHHQLYHVRDMQGTYGSDKPSPTKDKNMEIATLQDGSSGYADDENSEADVSTVYEDAQEEPHHPVLAHEDREDAFDYENFFLHSAMAIYGGEATSKAWSTSSEESIDSVSTARGPALAAENFDDDDRFDVDDERYPPGTPQTPEKLKEIEKNLHRRTFSDESVDTMASFETAAEGRETPEIKPYDHLDTRPQPTSPTHDKSRPNTVVLAEDPKFQRRSSSPERADSGVSVNGSKDSSKRPSASTLNHKPSLSSGAAGNATLSPPMSPRGKAVQDPATVAVNALLAPDGRKLGLRDKALLFGLVESLKKVCQTLQENEEASHDSRILRKRLDDARRVLVGNSEARPGTS